MKLDIQNFLPTGYELTNENPDSVCFGSDKTHVLARFSVKPIDVKDNYNELLKRIYAKDVETCKSIDDLEAWQLWQKQADGFEWGIIKPIAPIVFYKDYEYRRHPHADSIIEYHKCSDADKKRWQSKPKECVEWAMINGVPNFDEDWDYRLKPRTITINGKEYNAPMNVAPAIGIEYWVIQFSFAFGFYPSEREWLESEIDISALQQSHVFTTEKDCKAVADAFNEILAGAN